jgi:hypothetical protein
MDMGGETDRSNAIDAQPFTAEGQVESNNDLFNTLSTNE